MVKRFLDPFYNFTNTYLYCGSGFLGLDSPEVFSFVNWIALECFGVTYNDTVVAVTRLKVGSNKNI